MGQKVNPISFRTGVIYPWSSRWFGTAKDYSDQVLEDFKIRQYMQGKLGGAGIVRTEIERSLTLIKIIIIVSRPGVVIGKGGSNLELVKKELEALINKGKVKNQRQKIDLRVEEASNPDLSAKLVAERISQQLQKRFPHRRAVSQALERAQQAGAKGIKISLAGRVGGAEISRTEKYAQGSVPTQTLRADIDYFHEPSLTRSGYVGIKVWIYKGEII
ncbi:30S ribosomal protein S3 [Candidatus Woesebacteria bacterium]|nr:30S ribosomal protein S3 [Candidatus Woesebacteria bacterium]